MNETRLAVVKVGGSLFDWPELPGRLNAFLQARRTTDPAEATVLIAGGGGAADWIRSLDQIYGIGDDAAHGLAVRALDVTAAVLAKLFPGSIVTDRLDMLEAARDSGATPILAPRRALAEIESSGAAPLPASWDVTSDTIAARIAAHLGAQSLVLLKSTSLPAEATREDAARLGLVDPMLPCAARSIPHLEIVNLRSHPLVRQILLP
jgi:aspartokinase-like uncharacterized kinase